MNAKWMMGLLLVITSCSSLTLSKPSAPEIYQSGAVPAPSGLAMNPSVIRSYQEQVEREKRLSAQDPNTANQP